MDKIVIFPLTWTCLFGSTLISKKIRYIHAYKKKLTSSHSFVTLVSLYTK